MNPAPSFYRQDLGSGGGKGLGPTHNDTEKVMVSILTQLVYEDRGPDIVK